MLFSFIPHYAMKRNSSGEENEELPSKLVRRHSGPYLRYRFSLHQKVELDLKFAFVYYDNASRPDGHGILADYPLILQVNWKSGIVDGEMIVANVETKMLEGVYTVENGVVQCSAKMDGVETNIVDNLSTSERWEGGIRDHEPCGWGQFFDENNRVVYEGFRYKERNVCYGTYYHENMVDRIVYYQGMIYDDEHYGMGRFFDRNGTKEYEGEWIGDSNAFSSVFTIGEDSCRLNSMTHRVTTNSHSMYYSRPLVFRQLWHLEKIELGDSCFMSPLPSLFVSIDSLSVLRSITIGSFTCIYFSQLTITSCPSLERVVIANKSFIHCNTIAFSGRRRQLILR